MAGQPVLTKMAAEEEKSRRDQICLGLFETNVDETGIVYDSYRWGWGLFETIVNKTRL